MGDLLAGWLLSLLILGGLGCHPALPEPESSAAQLYQQRCSGCHRLYAPQVMTAEMWKLMVNRMEQEFQRQGWPPLQAPEKQTILEYLQKHSSSAQRSAARPRFRS